MQVAQRHLDELDEAARAEYERLHEVEVDEAKHPERHGRAGPSVDPPQRDGDGDERRQSRQGLQRSVDDLRPSCRVSSYVAILKDQVAPEFRGNLP